MAELFELTVARRISALESGLRNQAALIRSNALGEMVSAFQMLPGLRGFWPFSTRLNESGMEMVGDLSGMGLPLDTTGSPTYGLQEDTIPYAVLNGVDQGFLRADEPELSTFTEMTLGCWAYPIEFPTPTAQMGLMTKDGPAGLAFNLEILTDVGPVNYPRFSISDDGTTPYTAQSLGAILSGEWHFIVGRFVASTEVAVFDNGVKVDNSGGIPATLSAPAEAFRLGFSGNSQFLSGYLALAFVCGAALSDDRINRLYRLSRMFFGV